MIFSLNTSVKVLYNLAEDKIRFFQDILYLKKSFAEMRGLIKTKKNRKVMYKIVLLRHGESIWNKEKLFTGWRDVGLSENGIKEAKNAGKILAANDFKFDYAFVSLLKRALQTLWFTLDVSPRVNRTSTGFLLNSERLKRVGLAFFGLIPCLSTEEKVFYSWVSFFMFIPTLRY